MTNGGDSDGAERLVVRIEDLPDLYPGHWALVQVVEQREYAPVAGIVLAVGSEEHIQTVLSGDARSGNLRGPYFRYYCSRHSRLDLVEVEEYENAVLEVMLLERQG